MFGKKNTVSNSAEKDLALLMEAMDRVIAGDYGEIDVQEFSNSEYADKFNKTINAFKKANNNFVMRLNEAMESIGDNSYVKKTMDQVLSQRKSIDDMSSASQNLEQSIGNISDSMAAIRNNTHEMLAASQNSTANMNESIQVVNESSENISKINGQVQEFRDKIDKISEIVDIVKKVAAQSNLLALNASIEAARAGEAGKGFAVVADQVRQLSSNTSESAEDIVKYVGQLKTDIDTLAVSMNETTLKLSEGNEKVETSLSDLEAMNNQMVSINDSVESIFHDIDTQLDITKDFSSQVSSISDSYAELSQDCMEQGTHVYKIGRYIDTARSDMVRGFAEVTQQDWLRIFQIDHFILMWRVYNNAVGFEQLKLTQLNNPDSCKLGKWLAAQTDKNITDCREFRELSDAHKQIHRWACESWKAKDNGDVDKALEYFQRTYDAFFVYKDKIAAMKERMRQIGFKDETEIVVFRK
ncbi:MAG: methyl-accepting chemotaxis protein [Eubacteriales bacterium]|nr:methyl-accepting chemotaxis protein [Eubacteriales bacterium]